MIRPSNVWYPWEWDGSERLLPFGTAELQSGSRLNASFYMKEKMELDRHPYSTVGL